MSASLMHDFSLILARELDGMAREIQAFPDDESVWQTAPGVTNAAGNLALHLAGNVQHFIGALLGRTGYVRDREAEFGRRSGPDRRHRIPSWPRSRHSWFGTQQRRHLSGRRWP